MGLSGPTIRGYLDLLAGVFVVRQLSPWHENLAKRQVKSPKIYIRDSGLLHALLNVRDHHALELHPKVGASWEGYAIEEILKHFQPWEAYFWATHNRAELDLFFIDSRGKRRGVECKRTDAPTLTPSMRIAMQDLKLDVLHVVYPGSVAYDLAKNIHVSPLWDFVGRRRPAP